MGKGFLKLAILLAIVLVINALIRDRLLRHPLYGSNGLIVKTDFLDNHPGRFNVLFVGSSSTFRHFIPERFNRHVGDTSLRAFNFGDYAVRPPESYHILETLLDRNPGQFKLVFIELADVDFVNPKNLHTSKVRYYNSAENYFFSLNTVLNSGHPADYKIKTSLKHTVNFLERSFNTGFYRDQVKVERLKFTHRKYVLGENKDGFRAVEAVGKELNQRHEALLDSAAFLIRYKQQYAGMWKQRADFNKPNPVHLKRLNRMIRSAEAQGTHLVFVMQPRYRLDMYPEVLALFNALDPMHRIDMTDPAANPEFYEMQYLFDIRHLNKKGARVYTDRFTQKVNGIITTEYTVQRR